jgi:hypothetical protein
MRLSKWYAFIKENADKISKSDTEIMNYAKERSRKTQKDVVVVHPETRQIVVWRKGDRVI